MVQHVYAASPGRLGLAEREEISRALAKAASSAAIARGLGRPASTVTREIDRNGGLEAYRARRAHADTCERARRPKPTKFEQQPVLAAVVENWLETCSGRPARSVPGSACEFPDDDSMRVAPERSIKRCTYTDAAAYARNSPPICAPIARLADPRPKTARNRTQSAIPDLVSIAERPDEATIGSCPDTGKAI